MALAALNALEAFLAPLAPQREEEEHVLQGLSWIDHQVCRVFFFSFMHRKPWRIAYEGVMHVSYRRSRSIIS